MDLYKQETLKGVGYEPTPTQIAIHKSQAKAMHASSRRLPGTIMLYFHLET